MQKGLLYFLISLIMVSCGFEKQEQNNLSQESSDQVFQYSLFTALANKIYDGNMTVGELKTKGDLGLGTFNGLNGEMIVEGGNVYQFPSDGYLHEPSDSELVPFAVVTYFEKDIEIEMKDSVDYDELKETILAQFPSENYIYAFRINGNFGYIRCGSAEKQEKPYLKTLSEALLDRPVFEAENISGTMVGFWFPEYVGGVNIPGFHLHFIADDKKIAGHVIEFSADELIVGIDYSSGIQVVLPETDEFETTGFDLSQGYN